MLTRYKFEIHPESHKIYNAFWLIDAPWAHPMWSQYVLALYDLTSDFNVKTGQPDGREIIKHIPGATHEFMLYALDPEVHINVETAVLHQTQFKPLSPPNYGYQMKAASNEAATARVQMLVDAMVAGKLSPDTDFRSLWNTLLPDMYPLVSSGF